MPALKTLPAALQPLLNALADHDWHSGAKLAEQLGITRGAIWKKILQLQKIGFPIQSQVGKGYQLPETLSMLDEEKLRAEIHADQPTQIEVFLSLDSTNEYLRRTPSQADIHICLAESQSAGKGRLGRSWHSPFGLNFYGSIGFSWAADIQALQGLSLAVSVSILRALTSLQIPEIGLKWPNDIVYKGQKLSGILIEVQAEMNGKLHVIIGIGLNINALPESGIDAITQPWTSLRQITGKSFDRNHVTCTLINQLLQDLHLFKQEGCASFMKDWKIYDVLKGKTLSLIQGDRVLRGVADGVDATGQLRLKTDQGLELFSSGDASIVKEKGKEA